MPSHYNVLEMQNRIPVVRLDNIMLVMRSVKLVTLCVLL